MSEKVIKNWVKLAKYDYETAKTMYESGRYLYVAFMGQQAVEKIMKAIYVKMKNQAPPYTHNLLRLAEEIAILDTIGDERRKIFSKLNSFYIEARYTEEIDELSKMLTRECCNTILNDTKEVFEWLKNMI